MRRHLLVTVGVAAIAFAAPEGQGTPGATFRKYQAALREARWGDLYDVYVPDERPALLEAMLTVAVGTLPPRAKGNTLEPFLERHRIVLGIASGKGRTEPIPRQLARVEDPRGLFVGIMAYLERHPPQLISTKDGSKKDWWADVKWPATWTLQGTDVHGETADCRVVVASGSRSMTIALPLRRVDGAWHMRRVLPSETQRVLRVARKGGEKEPSAEQVIKGSVRAIVHEPWSDWARRNLAEHPDRPAVRKALAAALRDDGAPFKGRVEVCRTLDSLDAPDLVAAALDDKGGARRVAAYHLLVEDHAADHDGACRRIVVEWLADTGAADREHAAKAAQRAHMREAAQALKALLAERGEDPALARAQVAAIDAYADVEQDGVGPVLVDLIADPKIADPVRARAFEAASFATDVPEKKAGDLAVRALMDREEAEGVRLGACRLLNGKAYATKAVWGVLWRVLIDRDDSPAVQVRVLGILSEHLSREAFVRTLLEERVGRHPAFQVRTAVASALGRLGEADRRTLTQLCDYLSSEARDLRAEAWIALWQLSGEVHGPVRARPLRPAFGGMPGNPIARRETDLAREMRAELDALVTAPEALRAAQAAYRKIAESKER